MRCSRSRVALYPAFSRLPQRATFQLRSPSSLLSLSLSRRRQPFACRTYRPRHRSRLCSTYAALVLRTLFGDLCRRWAVLRRHRAPPLQRCAHAARLLSWLKARARHARQGDRSMLRAYVRPRASVWRPTTKAQGFPTSTGLIVFLSNPSPLIARIRLRRSGLSSRAAVLPTLTACSASSAPPTSNLPSL